MSGKRRQLRIGIGSRVRMRFAIHLADGEEVDATGDAGCEFQMGDGSLLPGFERVLVGLKAGDRRASELPAEDAFGAHNPDNVQVIPLDQLAGFEVTEGLVIGFADPSGGEVPGVVRTVTDMTATVDFNHPLAGRDVRFVVEILEVAEGSGDIVRVRH